MTSRILLYKSKEAYILQKKQWKKKKSSQARIKD